MLQVFLIALILMVLSFAFLSIKLFFKKEPSLRGCSTYKSETGDNSVLSGGCGCGGCGCGGGE